MKKLGVPVVTVITQGAFARDPLYNCLQKRKVNVSAHVKCLATAEQVKSMTVAELDALLARDKELDMLFERLYEDNVSGKIDDARFAKMSKRYEQEQSEAAGKIKALRLELKTIADVGLIGYPNVGKSSILSVESID